MRRRWNRAISEQNGNAAVLTGLTMAVLLSFTALVVDGGMLFVTKAHLQKTANAAVLSGVQELTESEEKVKAVVDEVLAYHDEAGSHQATAVVLGQKVTVELRKEVKLGFSRIFGVDTAAAAAKASAEIGFMGSAVGAAPVGIDESIPLEYGKQYKLKVDETEVAAGNFGILALGGGGARTYEDNLKYGYQNELKVGDIIDTQTGNIAGKTQTGIQLRIDDCPYPAGELFHRDCPRILLVPVYRPYNVNGNQIKQVEITGFAFFYVKSPMDMHDKTINGEFLKRADTGFIKPGAVDRGAFAIRLTE